MLYPHTHSLPSLHPPAKHCGIVSLQTPSVLPSGLLSQLRPLLQVLTLQKKKRRSTDNQRLAQGPVTGEIYDPFSTDAGFSGHLG